MGRRQGGYSERLWLPCPFLSVLAKQLWILYYYFECLAMDGQYRVLIGAGVLFSSARETGPSALLLSSARETGPSIGRRLYSGFGVSATNVGPLSRRTGQGIVAWSIDV